MEAASVSLEGTPAVFAALRTSERRSRGWLSRSGTYMTLVVQPTGLCRASGHGRARPLPTAGGYSSRSSRVRRQRRRTRQPLATFVLGRLHERLAAPRRDGRAAGRRRYLHVDMSSPACRLFEAIARSAQPHAAACLCSRRKPSGAPQPARPAIWAWWRQGRRRR